MQYGHMWGPGADTWNDRPQPGQVSVYPCGVVPTETIFPPLPVSTAVADALTGPPPRRVPEPPPPCRTPAVGAALP